MSVYSEIKEAVTTREAAVYYGHQVNLNGMMRCPFHNDSNPSMKVDQNYICFGCQEKGDVIRFTEKLFGLTAIEAAKKLICDFGLPIEIKMNGRISSGNTQARAVKSRASRKWREVRRAELFRRTRKRMEKVYCYYFHMLNTWREQYAPKEQTEEFHPLFEEALQNMDYVEYLLDILQSKSVADIAALIIEKEGEVVEIEKRFKL